MNNDMPTLDTLEALGPARTAAFFLERLQHEDDGEDDAVFRQWLAASETNRIAWDRALDMWDSFDEAEEADFAEMRREALTLQARKPAASWFRYAAAASIALVVAAGLGFGLGTFGGKQPGPQIAALDRPDPNSFGPPDYTTSVGQSATVELADGSRLTLDTDSAVDVAYADDLRLARVVRGQVYFEVAHDAARPFRVAAGERIVSVLGTRFNIRLATEETRVFLVEGAIGVSQGKDPARPAKEVERLSPGQELIVRAGQADEVRSAQVDTGLEWKRGFVQFNGETLGAAVAEMNRYTNDKLIIRDPKVTDLPVSGAFPAGDMDGFIQALTALHPVRIINNGGKREIVRK